MGSRKPISLLILALTAAFLSFGALSADAVATEPATKTAAVPPSQVRIIPGSDLNLVARESMLPVKIRNDYPVAVRVLVHVEPMSFNAILASVVEQTIPANTTDTVKVPISAIADGDVAVRAWIETFSGIKLGQDAVINLHIQAEIEESLITVFGLIVGSLAVIGTVRTLRKRRIGDLPTRTGSQS